MSVIDSEYCDWFIRHALDHEDNSLRTLVLFIDRGRTYAGLSEEVPGNLGIVKIRRMQEPLKKDLVEGLKSRGLELFRIDSDLDLTNRNTFYASSKDNDLKDLDPKQRRYLVENRLF